MSLCPPGKKNPFRYFNSSPQVIRMKLLNGLRASLLKKYTKTLKIRPNGHAVTITFTDFKVDVVPGF